MAHFRLWDLQICWVHETDKRPGNQGFKKSAEIGHGSSAAIWLHQKHNKNKCFAVFLYHRGEELPNSVNFLNRRLPGLLSFLIEFMKPLSLAHQNRTIAIGSDFRIDRAKSPEIVQKEGDLDPEIAARNRKSLATFHRSLKSQCSIAFSCLGNRCDFWGPRWASQSQIAKIDAISVRYPVNPNLAN